MKGIFGFGGYSMFVRAHFLVEMPILFVLLKEGTGLRQA